MTIASYEASLRRAIRPDRVAIYIRWSTEDQGQGTTLAVQTERCQAFTQAHGWTVPAEYVFVDDGYSGATLQRPALNRLRRLIQTGEVDAVVTLRLDRLSRSIRDCLTLILREWEQIHYFSASEPLDTQSPTGRAQLAWLAMMAENERRTICMRMFSGKLARVAQDRPFKHMLCFGYQITPDHAGRWEPHPEQAPLVRHMFDLAAAGVPIRQIVQELNETGVRTRTGKPWSATAVVTILRNRTYIGEITYGKRRWLSTRRVDDEKTAALPPQSLAVQMLTKTHTIGRTREEPLIHLKSSVIPAIVEPQVFDRVQEVLDCNRERAQMQQHHPDLDEYRLLKGISRCQCGSTLGLGRCRHYSPYYYCANHLNGCHAGTVKADLVNELVREQFCAFFVNRQVRTEHFAPAFAEADAAVQRHQTNIAAAKRSTQSLKERKSAVLREALSRQMPLEGVHSLLAEMEERLAALREALQHEEDCLARAEAGRRRLDQLAKTLERADQFRSLPVTEQRALLAMTLRSPVIVYSPARSRQLTVQCEWITPQDIAAVLHTPAPGASGNLPATTDGAEERTGHGS